MSKHIRSIRRSRRKRLRSEHCVGAGRWLLSPGVDRCLEAARRTVAPDVNATLRLEDDELDVDATLDADQRAR